ncbi:lysoplasmalogenase family protein [Deinococcus yavapaiensis]|uniref:YhhN-like protein n=1 Tax=Deinococcus yavapaiensis KR-236 TaxID=694435 RepID=A0A318S853_9DEIO|nr:lysoplasmalogenase family protein [Deinococcus yavapaiensis]PYE55197.1 YhhN-like protein [Deinococcus yavapaiensis KR-236]
MTRAALAPRLPSKRPTMRSVLRLHANGWTGAYILAAAAALWSAQAAGPGVFMLLKSLPVLVLLADVALARAPRLSRFTAACATVALAFALVAGAVIVVDFHLGTALWLGTHAAIIAAMGVTRAHPARQLLVALPSLLVALGMLHLVAPRLEPSLYWTVVIYSLVHPTVFACASVRALVTRRDPWSYVMLAGSGLFMLSDTLLALNRWVLPVPLSGLAHQSVLVQGTYLVGLWLLIAGLPPRKERM